MQEKLSFRDMIETIDAVCWQFINIICCLLLYVKSFNLIFLLLRSQRLRDQIKSWLVCGDIKDKQVLVDHRKIIEQVRTSTAKNMIY